MRASVRNGLLLAASAACIAAVVMIARNEARWLGSLGSNAKDHDRYVRMDPIEGSIWADVRTATIEGKSLEECKGEIGLDELLWQPTKGGWFGDLQGRKGTVFLIALDQQHVRITYHRFKVGKLDELYMRVAHPRAFDLR